MSTPHNNAPLGAFGKTVLMPGDPFRALSNVYMGFEGLASLNLPSQIYNMMPYIISLIVLAFTSKRSRAPKAEGIPYDKGQR